MGNACGRPEENRGMVFLGEGECFPHHVVCFLRGGRIEDGHLGEGRKTAGILLGLGGDGAGVVRNKDHQAAIYPDILQAHQRIGRHVQAHLLHGDQRPRAGTGCAGSHFHGGFFVDGPFHIDGIAAVFGNGFQDLGRGGAGIAADQVDTGRERPHCDGFIPHQKGGMHTFTPSGISAQKNSTKPYG